MRNTGLSGVLIEAGYRSRGLLASAVLCALLLPLLAAVPGHALADELDWGLNQRRLSALVIEGNESYDRDRITAQLPFREPRWYLPFRQSRFRTDELALAERTLRSWYQREGFHSATVQLSAEPDPRGGDRVTVRIREGIRTTVRQLRIDGGEVFGDEDLRRGLRYVPDAPAPFRDSDLGEDEFHLLQRFVSAGYLQARVRGYRSAVDSARVDVRFVIEAGQAYRVREIGIAGNRRTQEDHIRRELRLKAGDAFELDRIERSEAALLYRGWFRDVSFNPTDVDSVAATADLLVSVIERPTGFYEIGVGTGDEDRFRLTGAWGDRNLLASGRSLTLRGRLLWGFEDVLGEADQRELFLDHEEELLYRSPRAFGTRFDVGVSGFFRRETLGLSGVRLERSGLLANTPLWRGRTSEVELEAAIERVLKLPLDQLDEEILFPRATTRSLSLVFSRDTRDNPLAPEKGSLRFVLLQGAGAFLGGDNHFAKSIATFVHLKPLSARSTLAVRAQGGWADPFGDSLERGTPLEARFFSGGSNTVRGYRENSLGPRLTAADVQQVLDERFLANRPTAGGDAMLQFNAELRFPLPLLSRIGLRGAIFADAGNVWQDFSRLSWHRLRPTSPIDGDDATTILDLRTSIGFGLQYGTPVGPLRLDYGLPLKRAKLVDPDDPAQVEFDEHHIWHFSLGHAF